MSPEYTFLRASSWYHSQAGTGFALSSLVRVVELPLVRAARPFRVTGTMGVP
jgi:hypothetical protein